MDQQQQHHSLPPSSKAARRRGTGKRKPTDDAQSDDKWSGNEEGTFPDDMNESHAAQATAASEEAKEETTSTYNGYDVLLGRGRVFQLYPGNQRYHALINKNAERYANAMPCDKYTITMEIVDAVVTKGRFLKAHGEGEWTVIPTNTARQKVAHALQYQNRRMTKKRLKKAKAVATARSQPSDEPQQTVEDQQQPPLFDDPHDIPEHALAAYPNIRRTYFPESISYTRDDAASTRLARSPSEEFLNEMERQRDDPNDDEQPDSTRQASTNHVDPNASAIGSPVPVAAAPVAHVASCDADKRRKISFRGFRSLPFYQSAAAASTHVTITHAHHDSLAAPRSRHTEAGTTPPSPDSSNHVAANSFAELQQQWQDEPSTPPSELLETTDSTQGATIPNTTATVVGPNHHAQTPGSLASSLSSRSWGKTMMSEPTFKDNEGLASSLRKCPPADVGTRRSRPMDNPETAAISHGQMQQQQPSSVANASSRPPTKPPKPPPRFFPIDIPDGTTAAAGSQESEKGGDANNLHINLDLYKLIEDERHREQMQQHEDQAQSDLLVEFDAGSAHPAAHRQQSH